MMKKDLPENFPLDMNIATGNWGINTKCGYKPTFFGKIVCKEFPAEFTAEKYVVRIRMALAYNRFNIQRTPDSALILRSLIKGLPPVNSKAGLDVGGTVRGIVDVGAHFTPVPGGTSILHQLQEFTKRFRPRVW